MKISTVYKNNKSGVRGVSFETRSQKWRAYIQIDNNRFYLGYFQTKDEAIDARSDAEAFYVFDRSSFQESKYPLIDFVLKNKFNVSQTASVYEESFLKALGNLIKLTLSYPGAESFITYAIRGLTNELLNADEKEIEIARKYLYDIPNSKEKDYVDLYLKGYTPKEIAETQNISINTTYRHLKLSIQKLREEYQLC